MKKAFMVMLSALVLMTACSKAESTQPPAPLQAELKLTPETPGAGDTVTFSVTVTQADEFVDDATDVQFEVWQKGQDEHEFLAAQRRGSGVYTADKQLPQAGTYFVMYHVTAREMHTMKQQEFTVQGDHGASAPTEHEHGEAQPGDSQHSHQHNDSGLAMHFMPPESMTANQPADFTLHLQKDGEPFTGAAVKYEVWAGDDEKHQFIEAKESKAGEYTASVTLDKGAYTVKVHVEKGDIHDHQEHKVSVKS
jgi:opacity protein-like surface antigen